MSIEKVVEPIARPNQALIDHIKEYLLGPAERGEINAVAYIIQDWAHAVGHGWSVHSEFLDRRMLGETTMLGYRLASIGAQPGDIKEFPRDTYVIPTVR